MKNKTVKISTISAIILLSLTLNALLVQADPDGIGKYLTINIEGNGYVTATKVNSGEIFIFDTTNNQHKLGAGTVLLNASAYEGWQFVEWTGNYLTTDENPVEFKTEKYAEITAIFREVSHTIIATSIGEGTINPRGNFVVNHGDDQQFNFISNSGFHVSSILVDGAYVNSFSNSYTFYNVTTDHNITVTFSQDGTAFVPSGLDVSVFLGSGAGITFSNTTGGVVTGELEDFPEGSSVIVWELNYTAQFNDGAQIVIHYDQGNLTLEQEQNLRLISGESLEALYSDVNRDLVVDGTDVSIIANAVNTNQQPDWYDPELDVNNDGFVDQEDVHVVNTYKGTILEDITDYVDTELNIIYGTTSHFSVFRCR